MIAPPQDPPALQHQLRDLAQQADLALRAHDRHDRWMWVCYASIFLAIPFVVLLFRLHMEAWHYYVAGALFLASALAVSMCDLAAMAKRDEAIEALRRAQEAYEPAQTQAASQATQ